MAQFSGTSGADLIQPSALGGSSDTLPDASANGNDIIFGGDGSTVDGADTITPGAGWNIVFGQQGDDVITLTSRADGVGGFIGAGLGFGEAGNDSLLGQGPGGFVQLDGGSGNDTITVVTLNSYMIGGSGNDSITGGNGNDSADAGSGNDTVIANAGNDSVLAGYGADSVLGGGGNDLISGDWDNDSLDGGDLNDTVMAGWGSDVVFGSAGSDRLDGGGDFDTLDYSRTGDDAFIILSVQFGRVVKWVDGIRYVDSIANFESYVGTFGHDRLAGWSTDETFTGGAGNDTIDGGDGFDTVRYDVPGVGSVHVDLLAGFAQDGLGGMDLLRRFSATNNSIEMVITGNDADTIIGDGDDNWLRGRGGADSLDGGVGFDLVDHWGDSAVTGVLVNLGTTTIGDVAGGQVRDASGAFDRLANIEAARGTDAADTLVGSDAANSFRGMGGADSIQGGLGGDSVDHRNDSDANGDGFGVIVNLSGQQFTYFSFGVSGNVTVAGSSARDGWGETDMLSSIEHAVGSTSNDVLIGVQRSLSFSFGGVDFYANDRSYMRGRQGDDTIFGVALADGVVASYRDDPNGIFADLAGNTVQDGFGFYDTLFNVRGVEGSALDDRIVAGGAGSFMVGRAGFDTLIGGAGFDVLSYFPAAEGAFVDLTAGSAQDGDGFTDSLSGSFEFVAGSRQNDTFIGHDNGVWFFGSAGADSMVGGAGNDWLNYYSIWQGLPTTTHNGVLVNLIAGVARDGDGSAGGGSLDRFSGIENAVGSFGADTISGSLGNNALAGGEGNDILVGNAGADTLHGGAGDDLLQGGADNDAIEGNAGADTLNGGAGNDTMAGGAGDDLIYVNSSTDLVIEAAGAGADTVMTSVSFVLAAGVEVETMIAELGAPMRLTGNAIANRLVGNAAADTLNGIAGNDTLEGHGGGDVLLGVFGNDSLSGMAGNDTLVGGADADTLSGGANADWFRFDARTESALGLVDRITDFQPFIDDLVFSATPNQLFGAMTPTAISFNGVLNVASADLFTLLVTTTVAPMGGITLVPVGPLDTSPYSQVMAGINTAAGGAANVTASGAVLQVWQVNVAAGTAAGTYVFVNGPTAGAASAADMLIRVDLLGGTTLSAADFLLA